MMRGLSALAVAYLLMGVAQPAAFAQEKPAATAQDKPAAAAPDEPAPDLAFGAFQRGMFRTALEEALKRIKDDPEDVAAMMLLGELYKDGLAVPRNPVEAARWHRLAAQRGDRQGMFALGIAHLSGAGVPQDRKLAQGWFEKAAAQKHPGALYNLGVIAIDADIQDFPRAARLFRQAAELGDIDAAYGLAILFREGTGVARDRAESVKWLRRAAEERHVAAMVEFAIVLFNGDGVERNEVAAARYFAKAAQANSPVAQNRLARLYAVGRGVKMNMVEAMKWHILARANGIRDEWLDARLPTLSPPERLAVEEAVQRFIGN
jgi:TPR repeat protein